MENQNQNQEQFEMMSEEHAQYLARIAAIPAERLEAIKAALTDDEIKRLHTPEVMKMRRTIKYAY